MRSPYAKALVPIVVGIVTAIGQGILTEDWGTALATGGGFLVAAAGVYKARNTPKASMRTALDISPMSDGNPSPAMMYAAGAEELLVSPANTAATTTTVTCKVDGTATVTTTVKP